LMRLGAWREKRCGGSGASDVVLKTGLGLKGVLNCNFRPFSFELKQN